MGKVALVLIGIAVLCGPLLAGTVELIERADTSEKVEALAKKIVPRIHAGWDGYERVTALANAFERVGRPERGLDILRQQIHKFDNGKQDCLRELQAEMLLREGRYDRALAIAKIRLRAAKSHKAKRIAHQQIALCLERKKDWAGALEHYLFDRGKTFCGTCNDAIAYIRLRDVTRCRFFSGDADGALKELAAAIAPAEGTADPHIGVEIYYCDYSARAGRSKAAREFIAARPKKQRKEMTLQLALAEAFVAKDFARVVAIFEDPKNRVDLPWSWAGERFVELAPAGIEAIARRVAAGSEVMILMAEETGCTALLPAIERRLFRETDHYLRRDLEDARKCIVEDGGHRARLVADLARARAQVDGLAAAVREYRAATGRWPERLISLTRPIEGRKERILERVPKDPWGWPYGYGRPSEPGGTPMVRSRGPDRRTGTDDDIRHP